MTANRLTTRTAPFALRITRRREGPAGLVYRRRVTDTGETKLDKIAEIDPPAFAAGTYLLRKAVQANRPGARLEPGPSLPLDEDWGARIGCYAKACAGLEGAYRLDRTADHLLHSDPTEAAWWLGLMSRHNGHGKRAVRAFRILTEATE